MTTGEEINVNTLSGLSLARYVLERLIDKHDSVDKIAKDFDNDTEFISGIIDFLRDVGWVKQDENGSYKITSKGRTSTIEREKILPDFNVTY
jgi:predicted transcriptional regulator